MRPVTLATQHDGQMQSGTDCTVLSAQACLHKQISGCIESMLEASSRYNMQGHGTQIGAKWRCARA